MFWRKVACVKNSLFLRILVAVEIITCLLSAFFAYLLFRPVCQILCGLILLASNLFHSQIESFLNVLISFNAATILALGCHDCACDGVAIYSSTRRLRFARQISNETYLIVL